MVCHLKVFSRAVLLITSCMVGTAMVGSQANAMNLLPADISSLYANGAGDGSEMPLYPSRVSLVSSAPLMQLASADTIPVTVPETAASKPAAKPAVASAPVPAPVTAPAVSSLPPLPTDNAPVPVPQPAAAAAPVALPPTLPPAPAAAPVPPTAPVVAPAVIAPAPAVLTPPAPINLTPPAQAAAPVAAPAPQAAAKEKEPVATPKAKKKKAAAKTKKSKHASKKSKRKSQAHKKSSAKKSVVSENTADDDSEKLSGQTKTILSHIPSKLDSEKEAKSEKLDMNRANPEVKDALGKDAKVENAPSNPMNIKVREPAMDVSFELNRAYMMLMGGETQEAVAVYKKILVTEPTSQDALFGLAATYQRLGQIDKARPLYGTLLKINPNHREGLNNFLVLVSDESPQEALAELERLEQRNPDFSPIPAQSALVLEKLGYVVEARAKLVRAIELAPENMTYKYNLAILLDRQSNYADAAALYRLLIDASLKGEKIPTSTATLQKRLNYITAEMAATPPPAPAPADGFSAPIPAPADLSAPTDLSAPPVGSR